MKLNLPVYLLLMWLFTACQGKQESTQPTEETITESVYASGVVKTRNQYQVFATVNGLVEQVLVSEGDLVKKDQPIIKLLDDASRLSTENARLAAEHARVSENAEKLTELKINIDLARSKLKNDSALFARQQNLWNANVGTKVELEQRELNYKNSATAYKAANLRYADTKKQLDFAEKQSRKALEISRSQTSDFLIKSEADGRVYEILKEPGELVSPQAPVAIIGSANEFMLELEVDEYDIARVKPGQKVLLNLDSYKGQVFEGIIEKIIPAMDERSRTFTVEAGFVTTPPALFPNLTTESNIIIRKKEKALTIPRSYLAEDGTVLTEDEKKQKVKTGIKDYQKVEILGGLTKDDVILKPGK